MSRTWVWMVWLVLAAPALLLAQSAPHELNAQDVARIRERMAKDKALREQAQQTEELQRKERELREREEAIAREEAAADQCCDSAPQPAPNMANAALGGFLQGFSGEYAKDRAIVQQGNAQVNAAQQAVQRQQQREQARRERQQLEAERKKLEGQRQAMTATWRQDQARSQQAAQANVEQRQRADDRQQALREQAAAERKRLAAEKLREEAAERARTMQTFVQSSRNQQLSTATTTPAVATAATGKQVAPAAHDYGPAKAWCRAFDDGSYQCMGPLQRMASSLPTLSLALTQAGCEGGNGYTPTRGHGGSDFDCGRKLRVNEYRMPAYDPWRGGGQPVLIQPGE